MQVGPGTVLSRLGSAEAESLALAWLDVFGKDAAGAHVNAYMWHVFSYDRYPSVALGAALSEYAASAAQEFVVLSNERDEALVTDQRPESCSLSDYHVFPRNMAWTMSFTHEDGWLGPFFAKHPQFIKLNEENMKKIRKAAEAERARQKGYW